MYCLHDVEMLTLGCTCSVLCFEGRDRLVAKVTDFGSIKTVFRNSAPANDDSEGNSSLLELSDVDVKANITIAVGTPLYMAIEVRLSYI
jgi:serine/threonine protein kinase